MTVDSNQFIVYDRNHKLSFQERVQKYMQGIEKEESQQMNNEKFIDIFSEDVEKKDQETYHQIIEQLDISYKHESGLSNYNTQLPQLPKIKEQNKATFLNIQDQFPKGQLDIDEPQKFPIVIEPPKKKIPRYMQANIAWLGKDKTNTSGLPESLKDHSTNVKSKGSSLFPTLTIKRKKKNEDSDNNFITDQLTAKLVKQMNKYYVINREDPLIIDLFKKMCQEKRDQNIARARLTKGKLKAHLSRKYKGKVAEKILQFFDISIPLDFNQYIDLLERMLNFTQDKVRRIAYTVFDFNDDRYICQLDLYSIMKMYESDDQVFVNAYSYDICKLIAFLDNKKNNKGNQNYELNQKLKIIQKKVEQSMKVYNLRRQKSKGSKTNKSKISSIGPTSGNLSLQQSEEEDEEEEDEDDDDSFYNDIEDDDKTAKLSNKTIAKSTRTNAQSRRNSATSRRNMAQSRAGGIRKDFKRMNTNMSRTSRISKSSGKSMVSTYSRKKSRASFFSHYSEAEEEENKENPFDIIFGKNIYKKMKENRDYVEKLNFSEFKSIAWEYNFPQFIVDLINYISCFQINEYIKAKKQKEQEEKEQEEFQQLIQRKKDQGEAQDEKMLLEQFKRSKMTDEDIDLLKWKNKIGETNYRKFLRFFKNVCKNPADPKDSMLFLTQESILKKLKNHFGHRCEFLSQRFYYVLSDNVNLKRIYLKDFIEKVYPNLWEGTLREQMRFSFQFLDIDHDGLLNGTDLLQTQELVDLNSEYGQELLILVDHYVHTHLLTKDNRVNPKHFMHLDQYCQLIGVTCLIQEIKQKILAKPSKFNDKSVFFKGSHEQLDVKRQRGAMGDSAPKRAILMWGGLKMGVKEKKRVTFSYVPAYKDDEDGNHRNFRKKMAKDLPMSQIQLKPSTDNDGEENQQ